MAFNIKRRIHMTKLIVLIAVFLFAIVGMVRAMGDRAQDQSQEAVSTEGTGGTSANRIDEQIQPAAQPGDAAQQTPPAGASPDPSAQDLGGTGAAPSADQPVMEEQSQPAGSEAQPGQNAGEQGGAEPASRDLSQ
jgi:hypothetical protein